MNPMESCTHVLWHSQAEVSCMFMFYAKKNSNNSFGLLLGTEAPVMTPNHVDFSCRFVCLKAHHLQQRQDCLVGREGGWDLELE